MRVGGGIDWEMVGQWSGLIFSGTLAGELFHFFVKRKEEKQHEPADLLAAMSEFSDSMTHGGKEIMDWFRSEFETLREGIKDAREEAQKANRRAETAIQHREDCEAKLALMRLEVDELVRRSRVAQWDELVPEELKR